MRILVLGLLAIVAIMLIGGVCMAEHVTIPCKCGIMLDNEGDCSSVLCGNCGRNWVRRQDGRYQEEGGTEERLEHIIAAMGGIVGTDRVFGNNQSFCVGIYAGYISKDVLELKERLRALEEYLNVEYRPETTDTKVIPARYIKKTKGS